MRAMVLTHPAAHKLDAETRPVPVAGPGQLLIRVHACGVCRTDLHVVDGELPNPSIPIVPGHQIVGHIEAVGEGAEFRVGERVGVPWLGYTDGDCLYCRAAGGKTSASTRALPGIKSTAAMPISWSPIHDTSFASPSGTRTSRRRR